MGERDIIARLRGYRPGSRRQLRDYCRAFLGVSVPDRSICRGHDSPMDYLEHSFFSDDNSSAANGDCVVWANRGGGKTAIAAAATLLDCVFKNGCEARILGGSLEQSRRMYEYLSAFLKEGYDAIGEERAGKACAEVAVRRGGAV